MADEEKNKLINPEDIILTGSASHGFGKEDFEEELAFDEDEDDDEDDEDENTVEDG
jgi:hypothetical protein